MASDHNNGAAVELFTKGKAEPRNEDAAGYAESVWVLCDGSTDKYGRTFDGKSGGELASRLVLETALHSDLDGKALVDEASGRLRELYGRINPAALDDPQARFATTLVCARMHGDRLVVTQVGDSAFRINGRQAYFNNKHIDELTSRLRAHYIELTDDVEGSREFIMPLLKRQLDYSNDARHPLGYGVIDGSDVPDEFVKTYDFPLDKLKTLELFSDGYYDIPGTAGIGAYEQLHEQIERDDPHKCKQYPSTKTSDDRTVMIVRF